MSGLWKCGLCCGRHAAVTAVRRFLRDTPRFALEPTLCVPKILRMTPAMILPIGDAARRLGLSVDTLRRMDKDGRLPALRIGGRRCYEVERIDEFIRRHQPAEPAA